MGLRTRGLDELGTALAALAREPGRSVVQFAAACGLPRSSAFALVRHLEAGGILERDAGGRIWPGAGAAALGFGAMRLSGLEEAADALVGSLCEELDATAQLAAGETVLVSRRAGWERKGIPAGPILEVPVAADARLRLTLRASAGEAQRAEARSCLQRTAQALADHCRTRKAETDMIPLPVDQSGPASPPHPPLRGDLPIKGR